MLCCSRMSLEHTTENRGFLFGAFHQVVFAQNNKKTDALAGVLFKSAMRS